MWRCPIIQVALDATHLHLLHLLPYLVFGLRVHSIKQCIWILNIVILRLGN